MSSDPNIARQRLEVAALRAMARPVYEASSLETYYGSVAQQYTALTAKAQASLDKQTTAINSVYEKNPFVLQAAKKQALDKKWADEDLRRGKQSPWVMAPFGFRPREDSTPEQVAELRAKELTEATFAGLSWSVQRMYNADGTRRSTDELGKSKTHADTVMAWGDPNNPDPLNQVSRLSRTLTESTWKTDVASYGKQAQDASDSYQKEQAVSRAYQDIRFNQMKADKMSAAENELNTYKGPDQIEEPLTNKLRSTANGGQA